MAKQKGKCTVTIAVLRSMYSGELDFAERERIRKHMSYCSKCQQGYRAVVAAHYVKRYKQGDQEAFVEIYKRFQNFVFDMLFRMTKDEKAAEDLGQEVFMIVSVEVRTLEDDLKFPKWVEVITERTYIDKYRKDHAQKRGGNTQMFSIRAGVEEEITDRKLRITRHRQKIPPRLLKLLEPEEQELVKLTYQEGKFPTEVAMILDMTTKEFEDMKENIIVKLGTKWLKLATQLFEV